MVRLEGVWRSCCFGRCKPRQCSSHARHSAWRQRFFIGKLFSSFFAERADAFCVLSICSTGSSTCSSDATSYRFMDRRIQRTLSLFFSSTPCGTGCVRPDPTSVCHEECSQPVGVLKGRRSREIGNFALEKRLLYTLFFSALMCRAAPAKIWPFWSHLRAFSMNLSAVWTDGSGFSSPSFCCTCSVSATLHVNMSAQKACWHECIGGFW